MKQQRSKRPSSSTGSKLPGTFYAALKPKRQLASVEQGKIDAGLTTLAESFEMEVVYAEIKACSGAWKKALGEIRRKAKKIVAEHLKRRKKELGPQAYKSRPELRKHAGFLADEVKIEPGANEDRILEVLSTIGCEDEFEKIRDAAFRKFPVDPPTPEWMDAVADKPPPAAALAEEMEQAAEQWRALKKKRSAKETKARFAGFT
jgi:hypothetical protein